MSDANAEQNAPLSFDYFPGMVFARPPRFSCGDIQNQPALDWKGMTTPALKAVASRFPETKALCRQYDWTLRASYAGLFVGPNMMVYSANLFGLSELNSDVRVVVFVIGLALLGVSLLLNNDTSRLLRTLVERYNALAGMEKVESV